MLMKGAIGFSRKKGTIAGALRAFSGNHWDHTFVITAMKPEIAVIEASKGWMERGLITRYESLRYTTAFFFPDGVALLDIERSLKVLGQFLAGSAPREAMVDLLLTYLRLLEPNSHWNFRESRRTSPEEIFALLTDNPSFHKIVST